ncbi:NUDIX hydrolase domain-like protein [Xylaria bambusicola]|uniref:NUDIX hydrolase domain-like protein n=1 Tax=Xylaria bambusicola TaxID=326684 RepID=UPI0020089BF7|nr:NUDIX hydrolase domain-like protein [Xylaria bambusicola]KAI0527918.1 NUDIX hydrolase domain-like protein [Xylaria bambusicola]
MALLRDAESLVVAKSVDLQILNSSGNEFRKLKPSASGNPYDKIVVGAATLRHASDSTGAETPTILLLKRAPHEPYFPNVFELPSGKVDPGDPSLKAALVREVHEETGLNVTEVLAELKPMVYTTEKAITDNTNRDVIVSRTAIQLNYVTLVSKGEVNINTDEHSESCWVSEAESHSLDITMAMRAVVHEAFQWATTG